MFNTFQEVLLHVKERYANVGKLSQTEFGTCYYSHKINGIGCAIGCCVNEEDADKLDITGGISPIDRTLLAPTYQDNILDKYFSPNILSADLALLQLIHDAADSVEEFIHEIDLLLEQYKEPVYTWELPALAELDYV